jgi:hypothetical protein
MNPYTETSHGLHACHPDLIDGSDFFPAKEVGQSASISQEERGFRFRGLAIQDERSPGSVASKLKIF